MQEEDFQLLVTGGLLDVSRDPAVTAVITDTTIPFPCCLHRGVLDC